jgi:hypothetical protein
MQGVEHGPQKMCTGELPHCYVGLLITMPPAHGEAKSLPELFASATCVIRQLKTHIIEIIDHE